MRTAVSVLAAIVVGLAVSLALPALLLAHQQLGSNSADWVWMGMIDAYGTAPIWMPLAPLAAVCAYYSCYAKLAPRNQSSQEDRVPVLPGWKIFRATVALYLVMGVLVVGWIGAFAYRKNYACGPGKHIIQSDADAIRQAQAQIFRARYGPHYVPGYVDEQPGVADFSQPNCCKVTRTLTWTGVIVWEVLLDGETMGEPKKRHVSALVSLSNCGAVFDEDSYITAEPTR